MNKFRAVQVLSLWLCFGSAAAAQEGDQPKDSSNSIWLAYIGEHPVSQYWNLHLEGQIFWNGAAETRELVFARPGLRRELTHGLSALIAYGYFAKEPAITGAPQTLGEHRLSEDIQWKLGVRRVTLVQRVRAEQRFEGQETHSDHGTAWQYAERVRYRITANVPLPVNTSGPQPDYVSTYNEVFVNFGPHRGSQAFDQNLVAGAVGWNVTRTLQFEAGYLLQYNPSAVGVVGTRNHVAQLNLTSTAPFSRRKAPQ